MNSSLVTNLQDVGLPEKAALVYAAVLETGVAYPSKISETTKLNRSTVYKVLEGLRMRGLVTEIEHGKKLAYQIEDPIRLQGFARKEVDSAEEQYENAKKLMPELQGLFSLIPNKPRVRFFEGLDGVLAVYAEHVEAKEPYEMVGYSNVEKLMKLLPKKFVKAYVKRKEQIGITTRGIFPDTPFSKAYNKKIYPESPKKIQIQTRYIPTDTFPYEADMTMFGKDKVSIINFHENVLIGVIIEDSTIAAMMRMIFDLAWKGAKV